MRCCYKCACVILFLCYVKGGIVMMWHSIVVHLVLIGTFPRWPESVVQHFWGGPWNRCSFRALSVLNHGHESLDLSTLSMFFVLFYRFYTGKYSLSRIDVTHWCLFQSQCVCVNILVTDYRTKRTQNCFNYLNQIRLGLGWDFMLEGGHLGRRSGKGLLNQF